MSAPTDKRLHVAILDIWIKGKKYRGWVTSRQSSLFLAFLKLVSSGWRYALFRLRYPHLRVRPFSMREGMDIEISRSSELYLGSLVRFMQNITIRIDGKAIIGNNVFFNRGCYITVRKSLLIGNNCLFGEYVSIHDNNHVMTMPGEHLNGDIYFASPICIGNNVWVGTKATILAGVTVGDNVVIGANAVVTKDIPSGSVAVGSPARVVRTL